MAMLHSAFVFDHVGFSAELRDTLVMSLTTESPEPVKAWINTNRGSLVDPYEGGSLPEDWETLVPDGSVQAYGDFALTKYYDPTDSIGLDEAWEKIGEFLEQLGLGEGVILGRPLESDGGVLFDPGGCGSYFQTPDDVRENLRKLTALGAQPEVAARLAPVATMLEAAVAGAKGLYVTF